MHLKSKQRCRIVTPDWMEASRLEEVRDQEREEALFTELPAKDMFAVANLVMDVGAQDIEKADEVRTLLKDIWDLRQAKLRKGVNGFIQSGNLQARLNNLQIQRMDLSTMAAKRVSQTANSSRSFL